MKRLLLACAVCATALVAGDRSRVTRDNLATVEKNVDQAIRGLDANAPYELLGFTRGVYLPGYGVVLSSEANLVVTMLTPFHPAMSGEKIKDLRQKKIQRLASFRDFMRQQLVAAAATLDPVPGNEQIVFGVTFFYRSFEDREGLPGQIVMQAPKQTLLDYKANRISKAQLDAAVQVQEL
jgi:hypothetical protein